MAEANSGASDAERKPVGKDSAALRTIGEVAEALGLRQHVLRYWEQQFPMLQPLKRSGGRRYYRREDVELLTRIDRLVNREGYTLKGARTAIERSSESSPSTSKAPESGGRTGSAQARRQEPQAAAPDDLLPSLRRIRDRLAAALQA